VWPQLAKWNTERNSDILVTDDWRSWLLQIIFLMTYMPKPHIVSIFHWLYLLNTYIQREMLFWPICHVVTEAILERLEKYIYLLMPTWSPSYLLYSACSPHLNTRYATLQRA
jgi:hypothetical protein